ncbi:hypothetical protein PR001_g20927 [Phytophthora rubi]|nr:hypothetical protein PR001_g20927 [Phytophthora rubi]
MAIKALRKEFKEANDKYYNNVRLVRKKKGLERHKEEEARKAEYEAKPADYEKEMAKIHRFQEEMDLCDALVSFPKKTYAKELKEQQDEKPETAAAPVELDGMKPLQRKEEDFMMLGAGKKGKKARAGNDVSCGSLPNRLLSAEQVPNCLCFLWVVLLFLATSPTGKLQI